MEHADVSDVVRQVHEMKHTPCINVLHLTFDMRIGGTEMVIKNLITGNPSQDICMSIYCIEQPLGPWGKELQSQGIAIKSESRTPGFDYRLIGHIRQHIKDNNIDIVHCHQYTPWVYGCMAAIGLKAKVIFTEHGRFYPDSSSWKRKLVNPVLSMFTHQIIAISNATKAALAEYENLTLSKIKTIYNGILPLQTTPVSEQSELKKALNVPSNALILGTVARLDPIKNQTMMLEAFHLALKRNKDLFLVIVGDGDERKRIESKIEALSLQNNTRLVGYKSDPSPYMSIFDIFLLSSLSEGTSITLLESLSIGLPCIVTNAGGNPEIIEHEHTGLVTQNDDAMDFANAILLLAQNNALLSSFSGNAKEAFRNHFHVSKMIERYFLLYKEVK